MTSWDPPACWAGYVRIGRSVSAGGPSTWSPPSPGVSRAVGSSRERVKTLRKRIRAPRSSTPTGSRRRGLDSAAVERWKGLEVDTERETFLSALHDVTRTYAFLAHIIPFSDAEMEKRYYYGTNLLSVPAARRRRRPGRDLAAVGLACTCTKGSAIPASGQLLLQGRLGRGAPGDSSTLGRPRVASMGSSGTRAQTWHSRGHLRPGDTPRSPEFS